MATYDRLQPTRPGGRGQVTLLRLSRVKIAILLVATLTPACSRIEQANDSKLTLDTPIEWWHGLQGGKIAAVRPPPPGVGDPYPNLGQVPARPVMTDAATRRALAARLTSERDRTERQATQDPLVLPVPSVAPAKAVSARPAVSAAPPRAAPPPDPGASVAVMDAATAPAAPAPSPPLPPAAPVPRPAPAAPPGRAAPSRPEAATPPTESGPLPDLPTAEPSLPRLGGMPASVNAPAVPRQPPGVSIAFRRGSSALPATADTALRELAGRRAGGSIAVAAAGDAPGPSLEAQARALPLALRRAQAIQDALVAAGVPAAALRIDAAAVGRGGAARLIQQ